MIKKEIVKEISKKTGINPKTVEIVIEAFLYSIKKNILQYKKIFLRGFGSFGLRKFPKKKVQNIHTKKYVVIPEHYRFHFMPAIELKSKIRRLTILQEQVLKDKEKIIPDEELENDFLDPNALSFAPKPPKTGSTDEIR